MADVIMHVIENSLGIIFQTACQRLNIRGIGFGRRPAGWQPKWPVAPIFPPERLVRFDRGLSNAIRWTSR